MVTLLQQRALVKQTDYSYKCYMKHELHIFILETEITFPLWNLIPYIYDYGKKIRKSILSSVITFDKARHWRPMTKNMVYIRKPWSIMVVHFCSRALALFPAVIFVFRELFLVSASFFGFHDTPGLPYKYHIAYALTKFLYGRKFYIVFSTFCTVVSTADELG